jgi:TP901 family phage tail tape measure protein
MAKGITAGGGLKYKAQLDIAEALNNTRILKRELSDMGIGVSKGFDAKPMSAFQQGIIKLKQELLEQKKVWQDLRNEEKLAKAISAESKIEVDKLKFAEQELNNQLRKNSITLAEYNLEQKKIVDAQKLAIATQKEADRQASEANKRLKEQLALARQEEQQRDRNRKKLAQESSEYYKLTQALNNVRNRSKDLLAEMFKLELQGKKNTDAYRALEARSKSLVQQTQILDKGVKQIDSTLGLHQRHVGDYGRALDGLSPIFASINGRLGLLGTSLDQLGTSEGLRGLGTQLSAMGAGLLKFLISPVGLAISAFAALFALFQSNKGVVIDFDDRLLNVGKTTNLTGRNLVDLGNDVIELSRKLETVSAVKLLEYATVAGQLGVKGKDDILAFSEALAKLEIATNIKGEEGGAEIARLLTLTDGGVQNVKLFGDEIVNLGNNFAATEKEILGNAEAISQNTGLYRIGRQDVLAYAVATKAVGLEAEVVGSSFNRTLATFEKSIRTGKNLDLLAKQTGMTVDELKSKFKNDASGVFNAFIKGLNDVDKSGGSVNEILENIGIVAVRDQRVIATLATSGYDVLNRAITTVRDSSGSLTQEFDTASGKLKNQTAKFGIAWDNLVLSVENGQGIIGRSSAAVIGWFTDVVSSITPSTKSFLFNEEAVNALVVSYDELSGKAKTLGGESKLTKDEQEKLRKVTAQIGELLPGVITQFDQYGNALDINRGKITEMTKAQRALLELQNRAEIKAANDKFNKLQGYIPEATKTAQALNGSSRTLGDKVYDFIYGGDRNLESQQAAKDRITRLSANSYEAAKQLQKLGAVLTKAQQDIITYYEKQDEVIKKSGKVAKETADETGASITRTADVIKAEIKKLQDANKPLDLKDPIRKRNVEEIRLLKKELAEANGTSKASDPSREASKEYSIISQQRAVQAEIDALVKKGREKQLSADAQELTDIDAKYKKILDKAIKFNNDPKNKAKGLKVDSGGLLSAQTKEEDALRDKQNAATLKTTIDQQKKYYDEFEKYKSDFGLEKAKERYGKLINVDQTYLENLKSRQTALLGDDKAKGGDAGGGEFVAKQQKVLEDATAEAVQEEQKRTDLLLKEFMTYADKRKNLTEKYNSDFAALEGNPGAQAERTKRYEKDQKELDAANSTQLDSYEKLFEGIEKLSAKSALRLVATARKQLADQIKSGAIIDPEQIKLINALFDKTEQTIRSGTGQALMDLARQVDEIASSVGGIDAAFGKVLSTLGNVLGQVGNIKKGFTDLKTAQGTGSITGQLTAGLGIFGAGLNILQSVVGFFTKSEQREQQASYSRDLQNKQTEALNKALERQVALLDDVYGTERIKDYSAAIKQARENEAKYASELVNKYQLTGDKVKDDIITKLNNGETIKNIIGSQYDNYQKLLKAGELKGLPTDISTLQRLLDEGKLDANTATIVANLIKAKETAEQLVNNLRAETVGMTLSQIADDFISTLTDGTQDFGKTFEQTIQKSILNGFKGELIRKQLQAFYSQFATLSEDGLDNKDVETLRLAYLTASEKAKKDLDALSKATGIDLTTGTGANNSSPLRITDTVTETTANRVEGAFNGMRLVQLQTNVLLTSQGKTLGDLYLIASNNFAIQQKIEANTRRGADAGENALPLLRSIADNTKDSLAAQLRAGGKFGY